MLGAATRTTGVPLLNDKIIRWTPHSIVVAPILAPWEGEGKTRSQWNAINLSRGTVTIFSGAEGQWGEGARALLPPGSSYGVN